MNVRTITLAMLIGAVWPSGAVAQDTVDHVRGLYEAARYREALAVASTAQTTERVTAVQAELARFRALCFLATNQPAAADRAFAEMIELTPLVDVAAMRLAPSVTQRLERIRGRIVAELARDLFARARDDYERGERATAAAQFELVMQLAETAAAPALKDVGQLAAAYHRLASSIDPIPAVSSRLMTPLVAPVHAATAAITAPPRALVRQWVPPRPTSIAPQPRPMRGLVEVHVDASGRVRAARLLERIHPSYDALLLASIRTWRYAPTAPGDDPNATSIHHIEVVLPAAP
jgi:hypothetical protein